MGEGTKNLQTRVIRRKVRNFFWLNFIPLSLVSLVGYWFYTGELTLNHLPQGTEKLLWLTVISAALTVSLTFLTIPFAIWLRRSSKRSLKKSFPAVTGEEGFLSFLLAIPVMLVKLLFFLLSWIFNLLVIALLALSAISFLFFLGLAIYQSVTIQPRK